MKIDDLYHGAHIYVSAVRVFSHLHNNQPTTEDLSSLLKLSLEQVNFMCKKLKELGVIETIEGAYGDRIFIKDHLRIEDIPRNVKVSSMEDEIRKFQDSRKGLAEKRVAGCVLRVSRQGRLAKHHSTRLHFRRISFHHRFSALCPHSRSFTSAGRPEEGEPRVSLPFFVPPPTFHNAFRNKSPGDGRTGIERFPNGH